MPRLILIAILMVGGILIGYIDRPLWILVPGVAVLVVYPIFERWHKRRSKRGEP
jgi:hypothetical protein